MTLADSVKQTGIIGCGGAGFPTHIIEVIARPHEGLVEAIGGRIL